MRLGILSDIHGNLPALDAVLRALGRRRIDRYVCLGDIVGYGPFPEECLTRVREVTSHVVAGNHELLVLGPQVAADLPTGVPRSLSWTRSALGAEARHYISSLPMKTVPAPAVLATHGSLAGPDEYVWAAQHARGQLARLEIEHPEVRILLVGHTHRAMAYLERGGLELHGGRGVVRFGEDEHVLLNPGALGQSRQWSPQARAMVLDLERRRAEFLAVAYDRASVRAALRERSLAPREYHHRPRPLDAASDGLREARRAVRRVLSTRRTARAPSHAATRR